MLGVFREAPLDGLMPFEFPAGRAMAVQAYQDGHPLPKSLDGPPDNWSLPFAAMAEECSLKISASLAFAEVAAYFENLALSD
jgi:hypothetical protein